MDEAKSVSVHGRMHSADCCKRKRRARATVSPVKLEPSGESSLQRRRHTDPASLQAELQRKTAELAQTQAERDAALAEIRAHLLRHAKTDLQAELWRTTEKIKSATQERDAAIELEATHRELLTLQNDRDSALADLEAQKIHQREQISEIEADLQSALSRTLAEIATVRKQRDALRIEKHSQLSEQCDAVFEVEMALKVELRRAQEDLNLARQELQNAALEIHLQQEHQREQVRAIEAELQGLIQVKAEELKVARRERDRAVTDTCAQLEIQCDQVTEVEVRLQRNLKCLLGEIHQVEVARRATDIHDAVVYFNWLDLSATAVAMSNSESVSVVVKGMVQGVFYRKWTVEAAQKRGLHGWVRNMDDGSVEAVFSGPFTAVDDGPEAAIVSSVDVSIYEN